MDWRRRLPCDPRCVKRNGRTCAAPARDRLNDSRQVRYRCCDSRARKRTEIADAVRLTAADQTISGSGCKLDAEPLAHARADALGERTDRGAGRVAVVDQHQRVLRSKRPHRLRASP